MALLLFAALAVAVEAGSVVVAWDDDVNRWVHREQPAAVDPVAAQITRAGGGVFLLVVALAASLLLVRLGRPADGLLIVVAYLVAQLATNGLKLAFERPRPPLRVAELELSTFSFPSGHAAVSVAVYGALALAVLHRPHPPSRAVVVTTTVLLVALVALSRVALGVHYPSDVLAGLALGAACLLAAIAAIPALARRTPD